ncbi:hypothetical protein MYAM1_000024 [Malassezia yamatoensis]|uniref:Ysc84 actin-binding domain-containing protein n=1 Tax=Malassezia yamatoensis TaxID=253288 RepID=A0AAJ5YVY7_9BASI|nr:hypothetical protein MYAM1_000024 [Malassezia yamatoensis]
MPEEFLPPPERIAEACVGSESKEEEKPKWKVLTGSAIKKGVAISDWFAGYANAGSNRLGGERFWPSSGDFPLEIEKCVRILRSFTAEGVQVKPQQDEESRKKWHVNPPKVTKKIPPQIIRDAKGLCIYSSMKSAIAPFGGMNGAGLLLGRLPDGSWSAPSAILPNYYSAGFVYGLDLVDIVLIINTDEMLESFKTHKFDLTADTHISSGPLGAAFMGQVDIKLKPTPIYSYINSRGFYAGIELSGQVFIDRFDENERFYYWPGIKAKNILEGQVKAPPIVEPLYRALHEAETGVAQGGVLESIQQSEIPEGPDTSALLDEGMNVLNEGEKLQLPPTPEQLVALESAGIKDELDESYEKKQREEVRNLPPPPTHPNRQ